MRPTGSNFWKRCLILAAIFAGGCLIIGGGCGWSAYSTAKGILSGDLRFTDLRYRALRWCTNGLPFTDRLEQILDGKYIVLLQNNTELRPTGGFMGSYVRVNFYRGSLANYAVQDIYQPDGQLPGHVEPPYPVQESFRQGWWKLRDSNWDPDFASAAAAVKWFMEQGGEEKIKGIAAVNLDLLKSWIGVLGGVDVPEYGTRVTEKNLYQQAQAKAETRTEGNKTQKREFLGAVGEALLARTRKAGPAEMLKIGKLILTELNDRQILLWTDDSQTEREIADRRWDGGLTSGWDFSGDYLYVVDANLGANKADCCIERKITEEVADTAAGTAEKVNISWKNNNEFSGGKAPVFWGGDSINYTRVIVPLVGVKIVKVSINGRELRPATAEDFKQPVSLRQSRSEEIYAVEARGDLQLVGFWAVNPAGTETTATIELVSRRSPRGEFKLYLKRQPGVESFAYQLTANGKIRENLTVDRDTGIKIAM